MSGEDTLLMNKQTIDLYIYNQQKVSEPINSLWIKGTAFL